MERIDPNANDFYRLAGGRVLKTHGPAICGNVEGGPQERCMLHNPTDHHMRTWPVNFRADKYFLAERTCEHGVGHPDPDSLAYFTKNGQEHMAVHGCCGCCTPKES